MIDGAENNPPTLFTANHYTAGIKYYTQTNHLIIPEIFVMSKVTWDKLTPADQALVKKFAREAQLEQRALWDKSVADYTRQAQGRRRRVHRGRQEALLRRHRAGARQVRRAVRRPDEAHRRTSSRPRRARRRAAGAAASAATLPPSADRMQATATRAIDAIYLAVHLDLRHLRSW